MSEDIKNPEPPVNPPVEPTKDDAVRSDSPGDSAPKKKKTRKYTRRKKTEPGVSDPVVAELVAQDPVELPSDIEPEPSLEYVSTGRPFPILRTMLAGALVLLLAMIYLFGQFKGFNTVTAMDQAQIARQIAQGNGFSTKFIRPLAIWQLEKVGKPVPSDNFPDFFQSPLNPFINALPLKLIESSWKLTPVDLIYAGDRMIAGVSVVCFILALVVWFFIGARLFNVTTSLLACSTVLLTDLMWQFSLSGLPQMLMLLLFSGGVWFTLVAMEREGRRVWLPLALAGALFALMILAHGAAFWIFGAWMVFVVWQCKPRWGALLVCLSVLLVTLGPWLYRNQAVCGNAVGLGIYEMVAPPGERRIRIHEEPLRTAIFFESADSSSHQKSRSLAHGKPLDILGHEYRGRAVFPLFFAPLGVTPSLAHPLVGLDPVAGSVFGHVAVWSGRAGFLEPIARSFYPGLRHFRHGIPSGYVVTVGNSPFPLEGGIPRRDSLFMRVADAIDDCRWAWKRDPVATLRATVHCHPWRLV